MLGVPMLGVVLGVATKKNLRPFQATTSTIGVVLIGKTVRSAKVRALGKRGICLERHACPHHRIALQIVPLTLVETISVLIYVQARLIRNILAQTSMGNATWRQAAQSPQLNFPENLGNDVATTR